MSYNTTQLSPDKEFERHIFHRDQFAHYLRWTHVLKQSKIGNKVLDFGCGSGNLLEVLYRNRHSCTKYLGLDIRHQTINSCKEKWKNIPWAFFQDIDLCGDLSMLGKKDWDIIASFEVVEHVGKANVPKFLNNIKSMMSNNTTLMISTPCFDPVVGPADNHIVDGVVGELTFQEMKSLLEERFTIEKVFGTFASQRDYKEAVENSPYKEFYHAAKEYFDSNLIANLMAPLFPEHSRNCLWVCKVK
jgi:2-polyprenyl-3-methyl-5-hydroxy-6-metoxy-1,4-benzoquinol methylase